MVPERMTRDDGAAGTAPEKCDRPSPRPRSRIGAPTPSAQQLGFLGIRHRSGKLAAPRDEAGAASYEVMRFTQGSEQWQILVCESIEKVGEFMLKLCKDRKRCKELVDKPELATKALRERTERGYARGPKDHHASGRGERHACDHPAEEGHRSGRSPFTFKNPGDRPYPPEYHDNPLATITERDEPMRAFAFLLGEYTLRRCKN